MIELLGLDLQPSTRVLHYPLEFLPFWERYQVWTHCAPGVETLFSMRVQQMAKGQLRSNKEAKKPKKEAAKPAATAAVKLKGK
ncbi:hypothetical protein [Mariluticola halotolerans]|uniref:hypothetical protein n=1 Tax=Mariluticola halotolerans TaxID=2909283 RepID=UPI0026E47FB6|nr:hypothetical protein [Mariluticola halotolerans]UJQ96051.1 hypothetical protein L1P08_10910 [Mariluticola halotolerans]